jgi:hypothetical protein
MNQRPDYSPREKWLLNSIVNLLSTNWITTEEIPRKVKIKGRSVVDLDVVVVEIEGENKPYWLMACGNTSYDGSIIGYDPKIWIRECR